MELEENFSPPCEPVLRGHIIPLAGPEDDIPPLGVVGAVGGVLGLQAHGLPGPVRNAALAG